MINYLVYNYSILNFYTQRKMKNIFVEICELFHGNTNSKKIIQAYDFKIFIRVRLKAVYLKNGTWLQPKTFQSLIRH